MKSVIRTGIVLALVCLTAAGCGKGGAPAPGDAPQGNPNAGIGQPSREPDEAPAPSPTEAADPIERQIDGMTDEQKVGQLLIVGLEGTKMDKDTRKMIEEHRVGGFILYRDNIDSADQTVQLLNQLKAANGAEGIPLWLSVDQEGGRVSRMPAEVAKTPSAGAIGQYGDPELTYALALATGEALAELGFNLNFAPVLDIDSNPDNPVIGDRSFGSDAETVILHGLETMNGLRAAGVAPVVKHFPGHGDTDVDSHKALPVVRKSVEQLRELELQPFAEAIREGTDAVMVAHLLIPALDERYPASLSEATITGLLRGELGFDGVVMTDDMTMGGIVNDYEIGEAAVLSVLAGTDIVLVGHGNKRQEAVLNALKEAVADGRISEERLDESVARVLRFKKSNGLGSEPVALADVDALNETIRSATDKMSR